MCLWPLYRIMRVGVCSMGHGGLECLLSVLSTLWWQLRAFACAPSRDVAGLSPLAIKWTLRRNRVSSYFINLLPLLRPRRISIGPKKNWAVYQNVIYYLHYTLITIIANIIICFHVGLSVRPSRVQVPRSRSLIKFALLSLSLSACRGSRGTLLLAWSLLCIFRFTLPIFHLIYELSTLGRPSRYLPNDKYSFYSPLSLHALSFSLCLCLVCTQIRIFTYKYKYRYFLFIAFFL